MWNISLHPLWLPCLLQAHSHPLLPHPVLVSSHSFLQTIPACHTSGSTKQRAWYPWLHLLTCDCSVAKMKQVFFFYLIYGTGKKIIALSKNYIDNCYSFLVSVGEISRFLLCEFRFCLLNQLHLETGLNHEELGDWNQFKCWDLRRILLSWVMVMSNLIR